MRHAVLCGLIVAYLSLDVYSSVIVGGWSAWRNVGPNEVDICNKLRAEAERKTNENFTAYTPLNYRQQVVAGLNYEFKVYVGRNQISVLKVFQPLNNQPQLQQVFLVPLPDGKFTSP